MADGSASTAVGGFTIKASSGTASNGVFTTVFIVSRNGVQGFANDIDGIRAAAQSVQQRSLGGVVEDVDQWVAGGGAANLQQQAETQATGSAQSAGNFVIQSQEARNEGSLTQTPPVPPEAVPGPQADETAAEIAATAAENTVNDQRNAGRIAQGLATDNPGFSREADRSFRKDIDSVGNRDNDDQGSLQDQATGASSFNDGKVVIPNAFLQKVRPKSNPLDSYTSLGYNISLYLLDPADYRVMVATGKENLSRSSLLIRSAGSPSRLPDYQAQGQLNIPGNRSKFFDVDFYIDDLEIESLVSGTSVRGAHNSVSVKFKIFEPTGITFLDRLKAAVDDKLKAKTGTSVNYASQLYLLVIRFYGYEETGRPVTDGSAIRKYIPFIFSEIKFKVANRIVEYECEGVCPNYMMGFGAAHASIPFNMELTGGTLKEVLLGNTESVPISSLTNDSASDTGEIPGVTTLSAAESSRLNNKAGPVPTTITRGLVDALNKFEADRARKVKQIPNEYNLVFMPGFNLESATMVPPGLKDKGTRPMAGSSIENRNPDRGAVDNTRRNFAISAGTQITQVLDLLLQRSSYIQNQQVVQFDSVSNVKRANTEIDQGTGKTPGNEKRPTVWYKIRAVTEPLEYDPNRNDFAYRITYEILPYQINDPRSPYFPKVVTLGAHKKYSYWFTGANGGTSYDDQGNPVANGAILDLEQDFNYLYYVVMSGLPSKVTSSGRELIKFYSKVTSDQPTQGGLATKVYEPASNLASVLYSPADQSMLKMRIVGDPDYLQQSEIFYNLRNLTADQANQAFLPDGSINYDSREVLLEVGFETPSDYDFDTGVLSRQTFGSDALGNQRKNSINNFSYRVNQVTSVFSKGSFTQNIDASLMIYDIPPTSQTRTSAVTDENVGSDDGTADKQLSEQQQNPGSLRSGELPAGQIADNNNARSVDPPKSITDSSPAVEKQINEAERIEAVQGTSQPKSSEPIQPPGLPTSNGESVSVTTAALNRLQQNLQGFSGGVDNLINSLGDPNAAPYTGDDNVVRRRLGLPLVPETVNDDQ